MHESRPCFIDFSLSGYGYELFDVGSASSMLPSVLRGALLNGYSSKSAFTLNDMRYVEGLIFMDIFISYVFLFVILAGTVGLKRMRQKSVILYVGTF